MRWLLVGRDERGGWVLVQRKCEARASRRRGDTGGVRGDVASAEWARAARRSSVSSPSRQLGWLSAARSNGLRGEPMGGGRHQGSPATVE